jgi:hypothetical protein
MDEPVIDLEELSRRIDPEAQLWLAFELGLIDLATYTAALQALHGHGHGG